MNKTCALVLVVILAISCVIMVESAYAQTFTKPSVPYFTANYVDRSYYIPPTYGIDQYSGQTVQTGGGFTVQNKTIELTIKNQKVTPYSIRDDDALRSVYLNFQIRYKGHFGQEWQNYSVGEDYWLDNTVVLFWLGENRNSPYLGDLYAGNQVDFQVQARIGYYMHTDNDWYNPNSLVFVGESSDWSGIQTVTIPGASTSSVTPSPTPAPSVPEFPITVSLFAVLVAVSLLLMIDKRKLTIINH
jgi:hypothetical protein